MCIGVYGKRFNPVMLNFTLKAVPFCRKYVKITITSLQGFHVKDKPLFSFPPPFLSLSTSSSFLCLFDMSSLFLSPLLSHFVTLAQRSKARDLRLCPRGAELPVHLLPAALSLLSQEFLTVSSWRSDMTKKLTQIDCYINEHTFTV